MQTNVLRRGGGDEVPAAPSAAFDDASGKGEARDSRAPLGAPPPAATIGDLARRPTFVAIVLLSVLTRFMHLGHPSSVVFDEVHFGKFANFYIKGQYFFDIHPPLGKLVLALWGTMIGYTGHYSYKTIGSEFQGPEYAYMRMCPAFFSALVPPFMYLAAEEAGLSQASAVVAASFVLWDNCVVGEGKFVLVDSQLFFWTVFALFAYFRARNRTSITFRANGEFSLAENYEFVKWHLLAGVGMFLAFSVKWTALGLVGVIGIDVFVRLLIALRDGARVELWVREFVIKLTLLLVLPLAVYMFIFMVHFWCLPLSGTGDVFMSWEFKKRLLGAKVPEHVQRKGLIMSIFELHRVMFVANEGLKAQHTWGSRWYEWPTMSGRGVLYWTHPGTMIYLLGNPFVWWGTTAAVAVFVTLAAIPIARRFGIPVPFAADSSRRGYSALPLSAIDDSGDPEGDDAEGGVEGGGARLKLAERVRRNKIWVLGGFFLGGYVANLLPYVLIRRVCFAYHFIPTLIQGAFLAAVVVEILTFDKARARFIAAIGIFAVQAYVFYMFSPWTYGFPTDNDALRWRANWR